MHDIAGPIGAEWAIQNPVKVRSITFTNTVMDVAHFTPPFPMWTFRVPGSEARGLFDDEQPQMLEALPYSGVKNPDASMKTSSLATSTCSRTTGGITASSRSWTASICTEQHRDWLRDGLLAIDKPMQLVWGEQEIAIPKAQLHYIKQVFPLRAEHMVDAGHFLQEEQPAVIAAHIAAFAKDIAQQSKRATP